MILYVVRHGQSERNVGPNAPHDCELTEIGIRQARLTGAWLRDKGIETLYCSPAIRTMTTARIIGEAIGLRPRAWVPVMEWGFLEDEPGLTRSELMDRFPEAELDDAFPDDRGWASDVQGETAADVFERAKKVEAEFRRRHPVGSGTAAIVTHAGFGGYLLGVLLGLAQPEEWSRYIHHYNCGVSCIEFREDATVLWYANAHGHLGDLIT